MAAACRAFFRNQFTTVPPVLQSANSVAAARKQALRREGEACAREKNMIYYIRKNRQDGGVRMKHLGRKGLFAVLLALLFISVCYLADASYNPFLYFRF